MAQKSKQKSKPHALAIPDPTDGARPPLTSYLKGILGALQPIERRIAARVLADPESVITASISELRKTAGASVGSIVGFCRRLGFSGFADFKIALTRDLAQRALPAGDYSKRGSLLDKVFQFHAQSLSDTLSINSTKTIERVAQALAEADRIAFFSIGLSFPMAYTASSKFTLLGLHATAEPDAHMQRILASQLCAGDIAFGISCSGTTLETVECLAAAHSQGATTICLTNAMKSTITQHSDLSLYAAPSEINYFQAPLASRITQLAVIDALFVILAVKNKNKTAARLQQSAQALLPRRAN